MTRTERLLRLARLRGDRLAELTLDTRRIRENDRRIATMLAVKTFPNLGWSESEMRAAWGDR